MDEKLENFPTVASHKRMVFNSFKVELDSI